VTLALCTGVHKPEITKKLRLEARKDSRVSPSPEYLHPATQSDPAGQDYQRHGKSAYTTQSHDYTVYNTQKPTRMGKFISNDAQPV